MATRSPQPSGKLRFVALLRGVNVGGNKAVAMAALRELATGLGFSEPRTLLQSGNLVFTSSGRPAEELERMLEAEARRRLRLEIDFFVRDEREWAQIVAGNPFAKETVVDPAHVVAACLKAEPAPEAVAALRAAIVGREKVAAAGRVLYAVYPDGIGRSKLTHALIEKKLATRGTARNWNTVLKLAAMLAAEAP